MRMSVAEKARCYPFDDKGTDAAFEMVRTYFEKIGMDTSFNFGDIEYFAGIKMFNCVIDKLEANMTYQERYEAFDRIYEEGMQAKKDECKRNSR